MKLFYNKYFKRHIRLMIIILSIVNMISIELLASENQSEISSKDDYAKDAVTRAKKLNEILQKEYEHLGNINSILEYIGQTINRGALKVANKFIAQEWVRHHVKNAREIEKDLTKPLGENQLCLEIHLEKIGKITQNLLFHLNESFESKFRKMKLFSIPEFPNLSLTSKPTVAQLKLMVSNNQELLKKLRKEATNTGLTDLNLFARRIDDLNDRYKVIKRLEMLSIVAGLTSAVIYLIPDSWGFCNKEKNNLFSKCKDFFGPRPIKGKKTGDESHYIVNETQLKLFGKVESFFSDSSTREIASLLSFGIALKFGKQIEDYYDSIKTSFKQSWEKMKGFNMNDENSSYKVIEDLTLDDERIIGFDAEKKILEELADYVVDPEMYDKSNSNPAKSILLIGTSGCGKTLLAQALSGTTNKKMKEKGKAGKFGFVELKWSDVLYGKDGIKTAIEKLKKNAPCFGFIDELHLYPLQANGYSETLSQFLTLLSGMNSENDTKHQVILIGATNRPEMLDPAMLRAGRFGDIIIRCNKPNFNNRKKYFEIMFRRNTIDITKIDIDALTRKTEGCTYSDLDSIVKNARFSARTMAQGLSQRHLQDKIDALVRRIKKDIPYTLLEKKTICAHLAGQSLLYCLPETQPIYKKLEDVTIYGVANKVKEVRLWDKQEARDNYLKDRIKYGAIFTYRPTEILKLQTFDDTIKLSKIKLAGSIAQKIINGNISTTYRMEDKKSAFRLIKKSILNGIDEKSISKAMKDKILEQTYSALSSYETETYNILKKNEAMLKKIADELEINYTLTANDIEKIINER